jgi:molecular chaperone DnaK
MVYEVEKNLKEWEDKLDQTNKDAVNAALERGRKALKQGDVGEIRSSLEALQQAYSAAGASMYQAQQAAGGGAETGFGGGATAGAGFEQDQTAQAAGGRPDEDVVEADYEIVDDEKK